MTTRTVELPATTAAGAMAKLQVVAGLFENTSGRKGAAVRSLAADLGALLLPLAGERGR